MKNLLFSFFYVKTALVHPENQLCAFLNYSGVDAWRVIEIPGHGEFLLVFQTLAIYVDLQGRKSRDREIMYPALPTHISMNEEIFRLIRKLHTKLRYSIFTFHFDFSLL